MCVCIGRHTRTANSPLPPPCQTNHLDSRWLLRTENNGVRDKGRIQIAFAPAILHNNNIRSLRTLFHVGFPGCTESTGQRLFECVLYAQ